MNRPLQSVLVALGLNSAVLAQAPHFERQPNDEVLSSSAVQPVFRRAIAGEFTGDRMLDAVALDVTTPTLLWNVAYSSSALALPIQGEDDRLEDDDGANRLSARRSQAPFEGARCGGYHRGMLSKFFGLFGRKPALIQGAGKLAEGQSKRVEFGDPLAGGKEIVLCRVGGVLRALDRRCPHEAGGRIADGPLLEGKYAMCPLHGFKFDPATGRAVGVPCSDAKTYKVREVGGDCEIWL